MSADYEFSVNGRRFGVFRTLGGGKKVVLLDDDDGFLPPSLGVPDLDAPGAAEDLMARVAQVDAFLKRFDESRQKTPEDEEEG